MKLIDDHEFDTPLLSQEERVLLLQTANFLVLHNVNDFRARLGNPPLQAIVALTYENQTDGEKRLPPNDYVSIPGVSPNVLMGPITVHRRVDNDVNRRSGSVDKVFFKIKSWTRAHNNQPGYANLRPEGITSFVLLGFEPEQESE